MKNKNQMNMFGADSIADESSLFFGVGSLELKPEKVIEANEHQDKIQDIYDIFADDKFDGNDCSCGNASGHRDWCGSMA